MTAPQTRTRTSSWAVASLVLGIAGLLLLAAHLGFLALLAVIAGHAAVRDTKGGIRGGRRLAVAGLVLGYLTIAVVAVGAIASA